MEQTFWHILARAWSAIAFFHPFVQERGSAWEEALLSILPRAEEVAKEVLVSPDQIGVLHALLAALDDNGTRLLISPHTEARHRSASRPVVIQQTLADGVAYVRIQHWFDFQIAPGYFTEWNAATQALNAAIESASATGAAALILDFRETCGDQPEDAELRVVYGRMRAELVARLIREPVALPRVARVQRVGYHDPDEPGGQFGAYVTEWVTQAGSQMVSPVSNAFAGRVAILTGRETSSLLEPVLILLQRTHRATCIGAQCLAYHPNDQFMPLADALVLQLRQHALLFHDHPARYVPDIPADDPLAAALAFLGSAGPHQAPEQPQRGSSTPTLTPARDELPPRPARILAAIKLWTAMRTFYPYQEHLRDWDAALPVAIGEAARAPTRAAYFQACQRLASSCKGGHNFVLVRQAGTFRHASTISGFAPRLRLARIRGLVTVIAPLESSLPVHAGDLLEAVDGEPVPVREARLRPLFNHYPADAVDHYLLPALLDYPEGAHVTLGLRGITGEPREVDTVADNPVAFVTEPVAVTTLPPWSLLAGEFANIGYLDASRIDLARLRSALEALASAAAVIVDLRRYPTLPAPFRSLRQFMRYPINAPPQRRPVVTGPEHGFFGWLENRFSPTDVMPAVEQADERPLVGLIGGGTVSLGEDWASTLRAGCGATLVGGVTAGGIGANAFVRLPGGGRASFSGSYDPKAAAGTAIEGSGLAPDIWVEPVVGNGADAGVVAGASALLNALDDRV